MTNPRRPAIHLLLIIGALIVLATGAWWYTNSREAVPGIPEMPGVPPEPAPEPAPGGAISDQATCEAQGGRWNECASACPPDADACILMCVPKCEGVVGEPLAVSAYFSKDRGDGFPDCSVVHRVTRSAVTTRRGDGNEPKYMAALEELLKGPLEGEKGYFTNLPAGAGYRTVEFKGGTVTVDFGDTLDGVAGSCRVAAIRAQIEKTLTQFPEVKKVVIAANGETETVLQP